MLETFAQVFFEFAKVTCLFAKNGRSRIKEFWSTTMYIYIIYMILLIIINGKPYVHINIYIYMSNILLSATMMYMYLRNSNRCGKYTRLVPRCKTIGPSRRSCPKRRSLQGMCHDMPRLFLGRLLTQETSTLMWKSWHMYGKWMNYLWTCPSSCDFPDLW